MARHFRREVSFLYHVVQHRLAQIISSWGNRNQGRRQNVSRSERLARRRQQDHYSRYVRSRASSMDSATTTCGGGVTTTNSYDDNSRSDIPRGELSRKSKSLRIPDIEDDNLHQSPLTRVVAARKRSLLTVGFRDRVEDEERHFGSRSWVCDAEYSEGDERSEGDGTEKRGNEFGYFSCEPHLSKIGSEVSLTNSESTISGEVEARSEHRHIPYPKQEETFHKESKRPPSPKSGLTIVRGREPGSETMHLIKTVKGNRQRDVDTESSKVKASSVKKSTITKLRDTIMGKVGVGRVHFTQSKRTKIERLKVFRRRLVPAQDDLILSVTKKETKELPPPVGVALGLVFRKEKLVRTKSIQQDSPKKVENVAKNEKVGKEKEKAKHPIRVRKEVKLSYSHGLKESWPTDRDRASVPSKLLGIQRDGEDGVNWESKDELKTRIKFRRRLETPRVLNTLTPSGVGAKSNARSFYPSTNYTAQFAHLLTNRRIE